MEVAVTVLSIAGCVFLAILTIDRGIVIWQRKYPSNDRWLVLESDYIELKTFTHGGMHQLRSDLLAFEGNSRTVASQATERLTRLERKTDTQTETLDKMLSMIETALMELKNQSREGKSQ